MMIDALLHVVAPALKRRHLATREGTRLAIENEALRKVIVEQARELQRLYIEKGRRDLP